jgi:hypothetical protein
MPSAQNPNLLPPTVPLGTAALIAGMSPATFKARAITSGLVVIEDGQVGLSSLAQWLSRPISIDEYLTAERRRDPARRRQRDYRRDRR